MSAMGIATASAQGNGNGNTNGDNNPPGCDKKGVDGPPCSNPGGKKCTPRGKHKHYPPGQCKFAVSNSNPQPGSTITGEGEGYGANTKVDLSAKSTFRHLVFAAADNTGDFIQDITIPCDIGPGDHTIFASGVDADGNVLTLSAGINVQNTACVLGAQTTATTAAGAAEQGRGGNLPFTGGAATVLLVTIAAGFIAAGGVAVSVARRRRSATTVITP
jgi:hypothetical protein